LPDLLRYALSLRGPRPSAAEFFLRFHYLASPALANVGLLLLLVVPFDSRMSTLWLPVTALAYYVGYGRDLTGAGYRWSDLLRIYALNLLLLPVCLAGVACSIWQIATGRKTAFARTPKVGRRTATPWLFLVCHVALMSYLVIALLGDVHDQAWSNAVFTAVNLGLVAYGFTVFVGWKAALADLRAALPNRVPVGRRPELQSEPSVTVREPVIQGGSLKHGPAELVG
jgi:hypothetical protein